MTTAAYVRRSHRGEAEVSKSVQEATTRRLAEQHGHTIGRTFTDWGKSGLVPDGVGDTLSEILAHRRQALEMMEAVQRGEVEAIYAYRQDRLARDSFTVHLMIRIAKRAGVPIIIPRGDITAREQGLLTAVEGGMDEEEGSRSKDRARAANATMRARGDTFGLAPYGFRIARDADGRVIHEPNPAEPTAPVLDAYERAGTLSGAAVILNREGVKSKHGKMWDHRTVKAVVAREHPELVQGVTPGRRREHRPRLFAGLLRCHCGGPMSPGRSDVDIWYCGRAKRGAHDGQMSISENRLRPWIEAEAARLVVPEEVTIDGPEYDDGEDRAKLAALRDVMGETAYQAAIANLDAKRIETGERQRTIEAVPPAVDWEGWSTESINGALRALWDHVQLGPDLMPVSATWNVPEWRI